MAVTLRYLLQFIDKRSKLSIPIVHPGKFAKILAEVVVMVLQAIPTRKLPNWEVAVVNSVMSTFVDNLVGCESAEQAISLFARETDKLGFPVTGYNLLPRKKDAETGFLKPFTLIESRDIKVARWNQVYLRGCYQSDPVLLNCQTTTLPIYWRTDMASGIIMGSKNKPTAIQRQMYDQCFEETGIRAGISVPIHGPGSNFGYVFTASPEASKRWPSTPEKSISTLFLMAHQLHQVVISKISIGDRSQVKLSPRETECLTFVALGKSIDEIAKIIGISYSTVRFHLQNADHKLGTNNRYQTVAKAANLGMFGELF